MSSDAIITVEKLSKRYRLGQIGSTTLRESAERLWHRVRGRDPVEHMGKVGVARRASVAGLSGCQVAELPKAASCSNPTTQQLDNPTTDPRELWALKDVSFEVKRGEVLGIIGRNGAGKSTLLKILTRITEPTSGRAILRGRVASLLEVGTGFHPELTGRENVFLNGAILGMKKAEIAARFDEIVAFAEVERFIDTPVKRYSSGMYVRLAFAVAAHLEPEILLVDEVLAVGDSVFQRKCLGRMDDVAKQGRTVLFVSHNMAALENLCARAIVLHEGRVVADAGAKSSIEAYLQMQESRTSDIRKRQDRRGNGRLVFTSFHVLDEQGRDVSVVRTGEVVSLAFDYEKRDAGVKSVTISFALKSSSGVSIILHRSNFTDTPLVDIPDCGRIACRIPRLPLVEGRYQVVGCLESGNEIADLLDPLGWLNVEGGDYFGTGHAGMPQYGLVLIDGVWTFRDAVQCDEER